MCIFQGLLSLCMLIVQTVLTSKWFVFHSPNDSTNVVLSLVFIFFHLCLFFAQIKFYSIYFQRLLFHWPSVQRIAFQLCAIPYIHPNISFAIMPPTTSIFASPFYSCLFQIFTPWISTSPVASLNWRSRQRELISFVFLHMVFLAQFHPFYFQFLVIFMRHIWHAMITSILFPYVNIAKLNILHNNFVSPQLLLL